MNKSTIYLTVVFVLSHYGLANALSTHTYNMVRESTFLLVSLACLFWTIRIFSTLKGGSLQTTWLFFSLAFAVAAIGSILNLLDLLKIVIHVYDLRPANLATTCGTMVLLLIGLFFYRRGLD